MPSESYDSADLDALLELERSPGYALVTLRILDYLNDQRTELEKPAETNQTDLIRGKIAALRVVLGIQEILKAEIKLNL